VETNERFRTIILLLHVKRVLIELTTCLIDVNLFISVPARARIVHGITIHTTAYRTAHVGIWPWTNTITIKRARHYVVLEFRSTYYIAYHGRAMVARRRFQLSNRLDYVKHTSIIIAGTRAFDSIILTKRAREQNDFVMRRTVIAARARSTIIVRGALTRQQKATVFKSTGFVDDIENNPFCTDSAVAVIVLRGGRYAGRQEYGFSIVFITNVRVYGRQSTLTLHRFI